MLQYIFDRLEDLFIGDPVDYHPPKLLSELAGNSPCILCFHNTYQAHYYLAIDKLTSPNRCCTIRHRKAKREFRATLSLTEHSDNHILLEGSSDHGNYVSVSIRRTAKNSKGWFAAFVRVGKHSRGAAECTIHRVRRRERRPSHCSVQSSTLQDRVSGPPV